MALGCLCWGQIAACEAQAAIHGGVQCVVVVGVQADVVGGVQSAEVVGEDRLRT